MFENNIAKGVALLDRKVPDWRTRVNADTLNIARADQCVLGQLFGNYYIGRDAVVPWDESSTEYGFDAPMVSSPDGMKEIERLCEEWKQELVGV